MFYQSYSINCWTGSFELNIYAVKPNFKSVQRECRPLIIFYFKIYEKYTGTSLLTGAKVKYLWEENPEDVIEEKTREEERWHLCSKTG